MWRKLKHLWPKKNHQSICKDVYTGPARVHAHTHKHTQNAAMVTGIVHSPLWMRRCSFRWCLYLNALPHSVHLNLRLPPDCVTCLCQTRWEGSFSEIHNENTTFELLLIHVTMSLINQGQKFIFIYLVWKWAAKASVVRLGTITSQCLLNVFLKTENV